MTEETLNDYVNKIQSFNMNEDKRFDAVHLKDAVMAGYNICRSECVKADLENAMHIGSLEETNQKLTDELKALRSSIKDYGAGCYENGLRNGRNAAQKDIERQGELLEKAKKIIKLYLLCYRQKELPSNLQIEAEQLLKEIEQ